MIAVSIDMIDAVKARMHHESDNEGGKISGRSYEAQL